MESREYQDIAVRYANVVYRVALNYCKNQCDAEDAVQNTFVKLLQTDTVFADEEHIRRWLIRVAVNECKNIWRSFWRKNVALMPEWPESPVYEDTGKRELFDAVMRLPGKYSVVLHLYYYEGYSVREIAEILNISETNVQTRLMRARNKLKQQVKEAWQ